MPSKTPRKRWAPTCPDEPATHHEVLQVVKRRKIHAAEELFQVAQESSAQGDHSLLLYCSGQDGRSKRLQAVIDSFWTPDAGLAADGGKASSEAHTAPLPPDRLQELKSFARGPPMPARPLPFTITKKPKERRKVLASLTEPRASRSDDVALFDGLGTRGEVVFRPRCGIWRLRDFYEVLATARRDPVLAGVAPCSAPEGGFRLERSEGGWRSLLRAGAAAPRLPYSELTDEQRVAACAELRFGLGCGALPWKANLADTKDDWIDLMPKDAAFETDTLQAFASEERLVRLWAHRHVEDRQFLAIVRAFEECHHAVQQTQGFSLQWGNMQITAARHKSAPVSYGVLSAQACQEDAGRKASMLADLGGTSRSGTLRPVPTWPSEVTLAICGGQSSTIHVAGDPRQAICDSSAGTSGAGQPTCDTEVASRSTDQCELPAGTGATNKCDGGTPVPITAGVVDASSSCSDTKRGRRRLRAISEPQG